MRYSTSITSSFPQSRSRVYNALIDLKKYPSWNSGMLNIAPAENMREGMTFTSASVVLGRTNKSTAMVMRLKPDKEIVLASETGAITYKARYILTDAGSGTKVQVLLEFEPKTIVLNFAHSVVESMANARIKGDLQTLAGLLSK